MTLPSFRYIVKQPKRITTMPSIRDRLMLAACDFLRLLIMAQWEIQPLPLPSVMSEIQERLRIASNSESSDNEGHQGMASEESKNNQGVTERARFRLAVRAMESLKSPMFVDVQCLNSSDGYVIKEIAIVCFGYSPACILVKSPTNVSLQENGLVVKHGIDWEMGYIDLDSLIRTTAKLFSSGRTVYVKGPEQAKILTKYLNVPTKTTASLDGAPEYGTLRMHYHKLGDSICIYHHDKACAAANAVALMYWHREECRGDFDINSYRCILEKKGLLNKFGLNEV